jgi:hypothetical protein
VEVANRVLRDDSGLRPGLEQVDVIVCENDLICQNASWPCSQKGHTTLFSSNRKENRHVYAIGAFNLSSRRFAGVRWRELPGCSAQRAW